MESPQETEKIARNGVEGVGREVGRERRLRFRVFGGDDEKAYYGEVKFREKKVEWDLEKSGEGEK